MTTDTKLLPCPFCGANAHFEVDDARWEWVECESCGMQSNRRASLMEDCKPMLADAWNTRAKWGQPAHSREPVAWKHDCAALLTNDVELWIDACPHCGKPRNAPQPVGRAPLPSIASVEMIDAAMVEMRKIYPPLRRSECRQLIDAALSAAHGIKGGQHGTE